jgi:hypothetical protein
MYNARSHVKVLTGGRSVSGNNVHDSRGEDLGNELGEEQSRERGLFRRLEDEGVAYPRANQVSIDMRVFERSRLRTASDGGSQLPGQHEQGEVPRDDGSADSVGLMPIQRDGFQSTQASKCIAKSKEAHLV